MSNEKIILPNDWNIKTGANLLVTKTWEDRFKYAEVEISNTKNFFFESNGMNFRLTIGDHGFTLWDEDHHQWIVDTIILPHTANMTIGDNNVLNGVILESMKPKRVGSIMYEIIRKTVIDGTAEEA